MDKKATMILGKMFLPPNNRSDGYTLLEILLAIGVIAVLMGITIPYFSDVFEKTDSGKITTAIAQIVLSVHSCATEHSEMQRIALQENGLFPEKKSIPPTQLPPGWKLDVRRSTESRFRKPGKNEFWEFNSAGICEPLTLKIYRGKEVLEMTFDPLTGLVVDE